MRASVPPGVVDPHVDADRQRAHGDQREPRHGDLAVTPARLGPRSRNGTSSRVKTTPMTIPTDATPNHRSNGKNHQNIHSGRVVSMPSTGGRPEDRWDQDGQRRERPKEHKTEGPGPLEVLGERGGCPRRRRRDAWVWRDLVPLDEQGVDARRARIRPGMMARRARCRAVAATGTRSAKVAREPDAQPAEQLGDVEVVREGLEASWSHFRTVPVKIARKVRSSIVAPTIQLPSRGRLNEPWRKTRSMCSTAST